MSPHRSAPRTVSTAVLGVLLVGCAGLQPGPGEPPNPAEGPKLQPSDLAVVPARYHPVARLEPIGRTKGEAVAEGAVIGGAAGAVVAGSAAMSIASGISGGLVIPAGPIAAALLPVLVTVGAVAGAVVEERAAAPQALIDQGRPAMDRLIAGQALQHRLKAAVLEALRQERVAATLLEPADLGPDTPDAVASYAAAALPPVLEVAVTDFGFRRAITTTGKERQGYQLVVTLRGRLIASDGRTVLDTLSHTLRSDAHEATRWLEGDAALFTREVDRVLERSAQILVLEFFRLYYPPAANAPADDHRRMVPYFTLNPVYPQPHRGLDLRGAFSSVYASGVGAAQFSPVDDLQPVFRWEAFPRPVDDAGPARRFTGVRYEFRLYQATVQRLFGTGVDTYVPDALVYRRDDLEAPEHRLEVALHPCGRYAWTVRARFRFNDVEERVTEWTGAYNMWAWAYQPWMWRRGLDQRTIGSFGGLDSSSMFLLLRAPPASGQSDCPG